LTGRIGVLRPRSPGRGGAQSESTSGLGFMEMAVSPLICFPAIQERGFGGSPWRVGLGIILFVLGVGLVIWARAHIGRNWGTPMTRMESPELITSGPYHLVRHPIYTGILLAGTGAAVALGWIWLIAVALAGVYFVHSARVEERYLAEQLPDTYPAYKRTTKMLVPYVL
jgi:protein-S-isoprenylcysteine O-methyltransferase Ste14